LEVLKIRKYTDDVEIIVLDYQEELEDVLKQAGVDITINISDIGGRMLANSVSEEKTAEVSIDLISKVKLDIMEYRVCKRPSDYVVHDIKKVIKGYIVSIYRRDGAQIMMPRDDIVLREDRLVIIRIV